MHSDTCGCLLDNVALLKDVTQKKKREDLIWVPVYEAKTRIFNLWAGVRACLCVRGSVRQADRQEVLLRGAGTVVLIKAQAGDTMGGVPLFIHQPPISFGRVR